MGLWDDIKGGVKRAWDSDVVDVAGTFYDPLNLRKVGEQYVTDLAGEGGKIPGEVGYGDISSDLGVDPIYGPDGSLKRPGAYDDPDRWFKELYGASQIDRDRALGWKGTDPIRDIDPMDVPVVQQRDVATPRDARAYDAGPVERYNAARIDMPDDVLLGSIGPVRQVTGRGFDNAVIGDASLAGPVSVGKAVIDSAASDATARLQGKNIDALKDIAEGRTPSVAKDRLDAALAEVGQQQLGAAAAARGSERGGARREAILAMGEKGFTAAKEGAAMESAERLAARNQLTGALSGMRDQDMLLATRAAELEQQANSLQAEIDRALQMGNAQMANELKSQQAQLVQQARAFKASAENRADEVNANALNQREIDWADRRLAVDRGNQEVRLRGAMAQAGLDTDASRFGADAANKRADDFAGRSTAVDVGNVDRATGVAVGNANRGVQVDATNAGNSMEAQKTLRALRLQRDAAEAERARNDFATREQAVGGAAGRGQAAAGGAAGIGGAKVAGRHSERMLELQKRGLINAQAAANEERRLGRQDAAIQTGLSVVPMLFGAPGGGGKVPGVTKGPSAAQAGLPSFTSSAENPFDPFSKPQKQRNPFDPFG